MKELSPYEHWQLTVKGNILPEYQHRGTYAPPHDNRAELREMEQPTDQRELNLNH